MTSRYRAYNLLALLIAVGAAATPRLQAQGYVFGTASYSAPILYGPVSPPQSAPAFAEGDFNHDGIPDLAVLGNTPAGADVAAIFLGRPDGTFAPGVDYPVEANGSLATGDFNGDGKLDLVTAGGPGGTAAILFGNGDGTFRPGVAIAAPAFMAVAAADLNGDGKLDLVGVMNGGELAILAGNGDGTFQPAVTYAIPVSPFLVIGDFNGDGKPDIAVGGGGGIAVLLNRGDGSFAAPVSYSVSGAITALGAADLSHDGDLDLVAVCAGTPASVAVLPGKGDGTFAAPRVYSSGALDIYGAQLAIADFDGDGKLDLALTNTAANEIDILPGNGDGTFASPPRTYSGGMQPDAIEAIDVNGDGRADLAVVGGGAPAFSQLTVIINRGDGSFPGRTSYATSPFPIPLVTSDFNNDGHPDLATTSDTSTGGVSVLLNQGKGTFQPQLNSPTGTGAYGADPTALLAGDFNHDGTEDLVVADEQNTPAGPQPNLATLLGNGDGTFRNSANQSLSAGLESLAAGDFDGDGTVDVAATMLQSSAIAVFPSNGDGTFAAPLEVAAGASLDSPYPTLLAGDFNGDGKADLAVATPQGVAVLLSQGQHRFQPPAVIPSATPNDPGDKLLALGDFNGDGKLDVAKAAESGLVQVALGHGDGSFTSAPGVQLSPLLFPQSAVAGDFNGDGRLDLAIVSQSSDIMTVLLGNGDGTFCCQMEFDAGPIGSGEASMVAADFNGDGATDLAWSNAGGGVSVWLNTPVAAQAPRSINFGSQDVGAASATQTVTLYNSGSAPMAITAIAASAPFSEANACPAQLSPAAHCVITVGMTPAAAGSASGALTISDSASVVPQVLPLSGSGADFTLAAAAGTATSASVNPGAAATYALSLSGLGGFSQAVALTCTGTPAEAACTVSPASVTPGGASPAGLTVTVTTTAAVAPPPGPEPRAPLGLTAFGLAVLLMLAAGARWRRRLALPALVLAVVALGACGGGSGGGGGGGNTNPGTSAGTYTLTVTGTSGPLSHSLSLTFTVR